MKFLYIFYKCFTFIILSSIIVLYSFYVYAFITPKFPIDSSNSIVFLDIDGNDIFDGEYANSKTKLEEISPHVINAMVSIEDKNFFSHVGFDFLRILKAMITNITEGKIVQGASTISQQYIKNLYLTFDQTWERKIEEAYLTFELETHYSKEEILEGYLNTINFGAGNFGIKQASNYYFNKEPIDLTIEEATILVGIPKNPSNYNMINNFENAKKRQLDVLKSMYRNGYIAENEIDEIYNKEIKIYGKRNYEYLSSTYYYKDAVMNELSTLDNIPSSTLNTEGLIIHTNMDKNAQSTLEKNAKNYLKNSSMEVASVLVKPDSGKIIALIGGKNYDISQYNRAIKSKRQVGSTIKPFLYYSALENSFTPSTTLLSERTSFNIGDGLYSPKNAGNIYANKPISLLSAIAYSDNIYAMKTHLFLGTEVLSNTIERVGISTEVKPLASSALGTTEINIIDYSNGFITLANEGKSNKAHLIEKITDKQGNVIYEYKYNEKYVLNKKYVFILNNMLSSTYDYSLVKYTSPTLVSIKSYLKSKYAIKSGSTDTDYWTIGYNKDYLLLVWTGNDDNSNVIFSDSKISKKIWASTISKVDTSKKWYDIPNGIVSSYINSITGDIAVENGYLCYYEKGTEPHYEFFDLIEKSQ